MDFKKILVIQTAFIGDVILVTPLLETVACEFKDAQLYVLVTPQGKEILAGNPNINEIIVYDKKGKDKGFFKFYDMVKRIKEKKFDLVLIPHRSLRSSLLAYLAKIPKRIGFNTSGGSFLLTDKVPYLKAKHEVERNLDLAQLSLGIKVVKRQLNIYLEDKEEYFAKKFLAEYNVINDFLIGIAPGSVWATKRWTTEGYAQVADELSKKYNAKIIIFGGKEDVALAEKISTNMETTPIIAAGRTNLKELSALISKCRLFITNDTAPMHIAMAFNIPTIAIFGPTTLDIGFGPYGVNFIVVERKGLECRPCSLHGPRKCPEKHFACMKQISTQQVLLACQKLLKI
jgi:heptosyltransferase-2